MNIIEKRKKNHPNPRRFHGKCNFMFVHTAYTCGIGYLSQNTTKCAYFLHTTVSKREKSEFGWIRVIWNFYPTSPDTVIKYKKTHWKSGLKNFLRRNSAGFGFLTSKNGSVPKISFFGFVICCKNEFQFMHIYVQPKILYNTTKKW